jgi:hypothetical protein
MDDPKFIVIDTYTAGPAMFIFPSFVPHNVMALRLENEGVEVLSAGFVQLAQGHCYGRSTSLDVGARFEDDVLLRRQMYGDVA